ncbi:cell differentiation protein RCD1-like protein [Vairimorpha necatrix]|uniref:Cell differentiation protein RCD1-like protein n=1 Tax=Vairimorpha necatrix TaxID=6039 RepID=A0AAX4JD12_9MICR
MNKKKDIVYQKKDPIYQEIVETCSNSIKDSNKKIYLEKILKYLSDNISPMFIWEQNGISLLILQEIIEPYTSLQSLSKEMSDNLVVVLKILHFLVADDEIKRAFVDARLHFYLFRYVALIDTGENYEILRIWVLKIFSVLVTDQYVQTNIKNTEIIPIILKNIDLGSNEVKYLSVQTFYNLISGEDGLNYVTQTFDRFSAVNQVFNSISRLVAKNKLFNILKLILSVYIRLCNKIHIRQSLNNRVPENVVNEDMKKIVEADSCCNELYNNLLCLINKN